MRSSTRPLVLGSVAAGAAALGAALYLPRRPAATPPAPVQVAEAPAPLAPEPALPPLTRPSGCTFEPGAELAYQLVVSAEMKLDAAAAPPGAQVPTNLARTARSVLSMRALSTEARGAVLLARYGEVDANLTAETGDLTAPFLLRVDPRCQITGYAHLDTTNVAQGRAQQAMAYNLVWSWPTQGTETRTALNDYGEFRAIYTDSTRERPRVTGLVEAFTRVWADEWTANAFGDDQGARRKEQKPVASSLEVDAGAGPWFATLTSSLTVQSLGSLLESHVSVRAVAFTAGALDGAPTTPESYVWEDLLHKKVKPKVAQPVSAADQKEIAELRNLSLPQAMERYRSHVAAHENISQTWPHLKNYLVARPEAATELGKEIREGRLPEEGSAGVFVALGKAPTTEARDALLSVKDDPSSQVFDRARATFSLVDRDDVGVALAQALRSDAHGIAGGASRSERLFARHAALALGMMGSLKGADDPAIVTEARGAISEMLRAGRTRTSLKPAFGTIANLGDPSLLSLVVPYSRDENPELRRIATISIRRMPPASTRDLTVAWLTAETDVDVKRELYHVVQLQHQDAKVVPDRAIVGRAVADLAARPGVLTRQSLVRLLGECQDEYPEAKGALLAAVRAEIAAQDEGMMPLLMQYLTGDEIASMLPREGAQ